MVVLIVKRMFVLTDNGTKAMGIEIKDKPRELESGAQIISGNLGKTIQRLRKAYNLSLSELAEQSGVAKSIISQIERNETNPTLATIWRLSQALDVSIERVLSDAEEEAFIEKSTKPTRRSLSRRTASAACHRRLDQDGGMAAMVCVTSEPGGALESEGHQRGSVECLSVNAGEFEVEVGGVIQRAKAGETLRYRCDRPHTVRCVGDRFPAKRAWSASSRRR
jgi:XRE family transcriptional regulator, regulator of sulfur utilization